MILLARARLGLPRGESVAPIGTSEPMGVTDEECGW